MNNKKKYLKNNKILKNQYESLIKYYLKNYLILILFIDYI
jgi:hypothetical protein